MAQACGISLGTPDGSTPSRLPSRCFCYPSPTARSRPHNIPHFSLGHRHPITNNFRPPEIASQSRQHGPRYLLPQQDRADETRDYPGPSSIAKIRGSTERIQQPSPLITRRAGPAAATWQLCGRGGQGHGHQEGAGEGASGGKIWYDKTSLAKRRAYADMILQSSTSQTTSTSPNSPPASA